MSVRVVIPVSDEDKAAVGNILKDRNRPIVDRMHALFTLKTVKGDIEYFLSCLSDESVLLKHEVLYCIGQMQDATVIPNLIAVLQDTQEHVVSRHEAGEALGAIGDQSVRSILEQYSHDPAPEVAETCSIALGRLDWLASGGVDDTEMFKSVDPAPPFAAIKSLEMLKKIYLDSNLSLYERYRAMFTLRNINTPESIQYLCEGLADKSALFRHEVVFVIGQLKAKLAESLLVTILLDEDEHEMVRHEAAQSIGAIGDVNNMHILKDLSKHPNRLISESCISGMDICVLENSSDLFNIS